jgi:hypothetical protein
MNNYYLIKVDCKLEKSSMIGKYGGRGECLEALYMELEQYKDDHQIIIDRETDGKVKIYHKSVGIFLSSKDLICYYNIIEYPQGTAKSNLTEEINKNKYKIDLSKKSK